MKWGEWRQSIESWYPRFLCDIFTCLIFFISLEQLLVLISQVCASSELFLWDFILPLISPGLGKHLNFSPSTLFQNSVYLCFSMLFYICYCPLIPHYREAASFLLFFCAFLSVILLQVFSCHAFIPCKSQHAVFSYPHSWPRCPVHITLNAVLYTYADCKHFFCKTLKNYLYHVRAPRFFSVSIDFMKCTLFM
jgi:hypothetical protein